MERLKLGKIEPRPACEAWLEHIALQLKMAIALRAAVLRIDS